jgi:hypothetical protein
MTPIERIERAGQARALLDHPILNEVIAALREDALVTISAGAEGMERDRHCYMLASLSVLLGRIQAIVDDEKFLKKA